MMVKPRDPRERGDFDGFFGFPCCFAMNHLSLVEPVDDLGKCIVARGQATRSYESPVIPLKAQRLPLSVTRYIESRRIAILGRGVGLTMGRPLDAARRAPVRAHQVQNRWSCSKFTRQRTMALEKTSMKKYFVNATLLAVLTFESSNTLLLGTGGALAFTGITLALFHPVQQRLRGAADLACNQGRRRPLRKVFRAMLRIHPCRTFLSF